MSGYNPELQRIFSYTADRSRFCAPVGGRGIALYGGGKMGKMAIDLMRAVGSRPVYIVDKSARGELEGIKILSPAEIPEADKRTLTFVVCVVTAPFEPIAEFLRGTGCADVRHFYEYSQLAFPQIMPNGWVKAELSEDEKAGIEQVLEYLSHDPRSVSDYLRLLWWRLKRVDLTYPEFRVLPEEKYFRAPAFPRLGENEVYVDGGAHFGTTIGDFVKAVAGRYKHIFAFEPDPENLKVLYRNLPEDRARITVYKEALSDGSRTVKFSGGLGYASRTTEAGGQEVAAMPLDGVPGIEPTIIKLHIEGDELRALNGARDKIARHRPILMVLADHSEDGLFRIPRFLYGLPRYKLYFNLHDHCGNTSIFYAYPVERTDDNAN